MKARLAWSGEDWHALRRGGNYDSGLTLYILCLGYRKQAEQISLARSKARGGSLFSTLSFLKVTFERDGIDNNVET